jgi:hypothetical protein
MNSEPNTPILASDPAGDQATMLTAKRGDERAFGILCRRHWPKVFAVALRYTRAPRKAILAAILLLPLLILVAQQKSSLLVFETEVNLLPKQKITVKTNLVPGSITQAGPSIKKD